MEEEEAGEAPRTRTRHINKRALKNKALSVSFDEKDLKDYVTGFHKRKKKRRKEAHQKLEEAQRHKRIEARKKRKLEKEFVLYGGAPPDTSTESDEGADVSDQDDDENAPAPSVSGTMTYDGSDVKVTVTTSAISPEEEGKESPSERPQAATFTSNGGDMKKHRSVTLIKKKPLKRVARNKSRRKPQNKRDKNKGKKKNRQH